ncbi:restriction endonuclease [Bifidobacterium pseudolongum subsp. globosum]|uniref:Restriction endonuclease n=1 Tax=Bifidobacterium pseudolongum subsp. globosum TaxID=1690 RepID=A0A2N3QJ36_9BIFI|nr:DEAD/DEAH box helicase family protein [Bifidobacterium pseudolongum]PKU91456.1 restriction endonuclease [Bifidobacterium pseudolongum subsp. globosum]
MHFQFAQYQYQTDATNAVCDVFDGQSKQEETSYIRDQGHWTRGDQSTLTVAAKDDGFGYRNAPIELPPSVLLENMQRIQKKQALKVSPSLYRHPLGAVSLDVEMETGTGKTFVYTKTIFELNRRYGWNKFIVVVPSIAIREGVYSSFETTSDYFYMSGKDGHEGYKKQLKYFVYSSSNLTQLDTFAQSPDISVMIINMQAFNTSMKEGGRSKESRIIYSERDEFGSRRRIDVISATHPIIILDEPQKMGGKATQEGIRRFNPLFTLHYSATHREKHDLVYSLDALDAYNQRLVKRIEVKGFELHNMRGTDGYLYLQDIVISKNKPPRARIEFKALAGSGIVTKRVRSFEEGESIYEASGELEAYHDDWRIAPDGIVPDTDHELGYVRFLNGTVLRKGQILNDGAETDMRRVQIRETILSHLQKEEHLWERGIKCLSLFFIDEVAKYRRYDEEGEAIKGEYARIFEEEYDRCVQWFLDGRLDDGHGYVDWLRTTWGRSVHQGYFSIDKHGHAIDSKLKRGSDESDDTDAYNLILRDKERLLSFDEPTRFIFSHSALREGWDNPNVFQICTLKHSNNEISKRQEVGRGLRICVNRDGVRQDVNVLGESLVQQVNLLTVIASESYERFSEDLQKDMRSELRDRQMRITDGFFTKVTIHPEQLGTQYMGGEDVTFDAGESHLIYMLLYKFDYIDSDGNITDRYKETGLSEVFVEELPQELQKKAPAIGVALKSVVEDRLINYVGDGLKKKISLNRLNENFGKKEFIELWNRINHKYTYTVNFDDDELVDKAIGDINDNLVVAELSYSVTKGTQKELLTGEDLALGAHFKRSANSTYRQRIDIDATNGVKYDLLGEVAQAAVITRACAARILSGIRADKFSMFRNNPEQFIAQVSRCIIRQKATMIVEHIIYTRADGSYDSTIFTNVPPQDEIKGMQVTKCIQDWIFPDSDGEGRFAKKLETEGDVVVYAKLPRGFRIPTPVGNYAPDWAIAFKEGTSIRHLFFVAETKGSMDTLDLKGVEKGKIECAKTLFNDLKLAGDVHYGRVATYEDLLSIAKADK